jgi:hypothetical protein
MESPPLLVTTVIRAQEPGAELEVIIANAANLLVGNYNVIEHIACQGLRHGQLKHVFELAGVVF